MSIFFIDCNTLSKLGLVSIIMSSISIIENSFPLYILLKSSSNHLDVAVQSFVRIIRAYLLALIVTDVFGAMIVMPMLLLSDLRNMRCWRSHLLHIDPETICMLSFALYFAYKLTSMFLITFTGYSCFLHYNQNHRLQSMNGNSTIDRQNNCICEAQPSLSTAASTQSNHSCGNQEQNTSRKSRIPRRGTMLFMLFLIVLFSFFVACLPLIGFGPFNYKTTGNTSLTNNTLPATNSSESYDDDYACMLHSFAKPKMAKEYIFVFALLMASGVCTLILVYTFIALFGGHFKSSHSIFAEMIQFVIVQGFLFLATWIPVLISICFAMSGKVVKQQVQSYLILITFLNCISHPFFYGFCLTIIRDGYKEILKSLRDIMKCLLSTNKAQSHTSVPTDEK